MAREAVSFRLDDSSTGIGRRYARTGPAAILYLSHFPPYFTSHILDEIAIPFGVTVDFQTVKVPNCAPLCPSSPPSITPHRPGRHGHGSRA